MTIVFDAKSDPSRFSLHRLTEVVKHSSFTALVRDDVMKVEFHAEERGDTITFVMSSKAKAEEMQKLLPAIFKRIQKCYTEIDRNIFNVKTGS